jgi:hypothetical protein
VKTEVAIVKRFFEEGQELTPKFPGQDLKRDKELLPRPDKTGSVKGQPAARNNAMDMGMIHQILAPSMKDRDTANLRPQILGVPGEFNT